MIVHGEMNDWIDQKRINEGNNELLIELINELIVNESTNAWVNERKS